MYRKSYDNSKLNILSTFHCVQTPFALNMRLDYTALLVLPHLHQMTTSIKECVFSTMKVNNFAINKIQSTKRKKNI